MKKFLSSFMMFALAATCIYAQKQAAPVTPAMPIDSITHKITYQAVVEVQGSKADVLYKRTLAWFKSHYPNPTEVIRENDSVKFRIEGKPRFRIYHSPDKSGLKTDAGLIQYTITVACKDGRFRYELSEFNWKQPSYYACEKWMDTKDQYYGTDMAGYLAQLDAYAKDLIKTLNEAVSKDKAAKDRDNW